MEQRTEKVPHGAGDQTIGRRRQQQDDYWLGRTVGRVKSEQGLVGILADGMGGHSGGRQAALAAVCGFRAAFYSHTEGDQQLDIGVEEANQMVREFQEAEGHEPGATGTTLIGVRITKDTIQWISIGDSRLLLVDSRGIRQLNADHSMKPEIRKRQKANPEAAHGLNPHELRSAVGGVRIEMIDRGQRPVPKEGATLILASDGIDSLEDSMIQAVTTMAAGSGPGGIVRALLEEVENCGRPRQDNTTIIAFRWDGGQHTTRKTEPGVERSLDPTVINSGTPRPRVKRTRMALMKRARKAAAGAAMTAMLLAGGSGEAQEAEPREATAALTAAVEAAQAEVEAAAEAVRAIETELGELSLPDGGNEGAAARATRAEMEAELSEARSLQAQAEERRRRVEAQLRDTQRRLEEERERAAESEEAAEVARTAAEEAENTAEEARTREAEAREAADAEREAAERETARREEMERRRAIEIRYWLAGLLAVVLAAITAWILTRKRAAEQLAEQEEAHENRVAEHEAKERVLQGQLDGAMKPADHALLLEGRSLDGAGVSLKITREQLGAAGRVVIGRNAHDVDAVLDDPQVSRKHVLLVDEGQGVEIEDLGSTNGTFVNGRQLRHGERARIEPTDEIGIGRSLVFRIREE